MGDDKIYLSREEQQFLIDWLELPDPMDAVDKFAEMISQEKGDPVKLQDYIKKIMKRLKQ
ncbi:MAG TPA: hypothetical protein VIJ14_04920 [Rhabdochlamydiaceae bacterium]